MGVGKLCYVTGILWNRSSQLLPLLLLLLGLRAFRTRIAHHESTCGSPGPGYPTPGTHWGKESGWTGPIHYCCYYWTPARWFWPQCQRVTGSQSHRVTGSSSHRVTKLPISASLRLCKVIYPGRHCWPKTTRHQWCHLWVVRGHAEQPNQAPSTVQSYTTWHSNFKEFG